jgi:hypothetical protein
MDAFRKVRREKSNEEGRDEEKETVKRGQSSLEENQVWPLYFPGGVMPSFPTKKAHQRIGAEADDSCSSSSGYSAYSSSFSERHSSCSSPMSSSSEESGLDDLEQSYLRAKLQSSLYHASLSMAHQCSGHSPQLLIRKSEQPPQQSTSAIHGKSPLFAVGSDIMAQVMTFLEPPEILGILTMPLSKEWRRTFSANQDLWKVLCLLEPFKANVGDSEDDDDSDDSFCDLNYEAEGGANNLFGKYRLMFTSFVRCIRYLSRIKEDTLNGRTPSLVEGAGFPHSGASKSLRKFLSLSPEAVVGTAQIEADEDDISAAPIGVADNGTLTDDGSSGRKVRFFLGEKGYGFVSIESLIHFFSSPLALSAQRPASLDEKPPAKKLKYADSIVTARLFGPSATGEAGNVDLPRSCAIYSIVNWMVAFSDVEGIQTMCVKALPCLLEDEEQRLLAQRAGLTDAILRAMILFRDSLELHTAAFHTMVLLARPVGGREGMLFDNSMANSSTIGLLDSSSQDTGRASSPGRSNPTNGIAIMLDSMSRFLGEEKLQAMACWAMVNIALAPSQKSMLIKLGGIQATANAMRKHPHSADVQFRALFALINLVVPCKYPTGTARSFPSHVSNSSTSTDSASGEQEMNEKEILDELVGEVIGLVVSAMKNFCSSETILNRACLVLHNLSQSQDYIATLLWTPHCYQMLEWCITNYPTDQVRRRSAVSTLHRLQVTLSGDAGMRVRFAESMRVEQEFSLHNPQQAHV